MQTLSVRHVAFLHRLICAPPPPIPSINPPPPKYIYRQLVWYIDFVTLMATCHKHVMRVNVEEWFIKIAIRQWRIKDLFVYAMTAVCISEC